MTHVKAASRTAADNRQERVGARQQCAEVGGRQLTPLPIREGSGEGRESSQRTPLSQPLTGGERCGAAPSTRRAAVAPRVILGWIVIIILVAIGLRAAAPWILPVRVYEGPLVQLAEPEAATLVWYTTRPAQCVVKLSIDGEPREWVSSPAGRRHSVRVTGLAPGRSYPYAIHAGVRRLTTDLALQTSRTDPHFSFLVFGDSGKGTRGQYLLADDMARVNPPPEFLLHTGDLVYPDGSRLRYEQNFFAPYHGLLARVVFWPSLGNHDVNDNGGAAYREVFELPENGPPGLTPEHNYWFDYATARFVVFDSSVSEEIVGNQIAPWLAEVLRDPAPVWRFVVCHHPPYTSGKYAPDARLQRTIVPVLEAAGVDVMFNGHDHTYQRTHALCGGEVVPDGRGTVYVVTGAGGAALYDLKQPAPAYIAYGAADQLSFTRVTIADRKVTLQQLGQGGAELDRWEYEKPAVTSMPADVPSSAPAPAAP